MLFDLRHSLRLTRKSPLLTAAIILTLAVGVGVDVGVFTLIDGLLFKPRVADDADRFVEVTLRSTVVDAGVTPYVSLQDYRAFTSEARSFTELAAWTPVHAAVARTPTQPLAERVIPLLVTCNFFGIYGSEPPIAGRLFRLDECDEARPVPVAVIGEDLWRTRFGATADLVGATIALDRRAFTVVGIMPSGYAGHLRTDIWIPYPMAAAFYGGRDVVREPATPWLMTLAGRLRPGATWNAARTELTAIAARQDRLVAGRSTVVHLSNGSIIGSDAVEPMTFWIVPLVMGALTLVVLLVCANVATLLLSRAAARRREMAIRVSLGGTRMQLMRMLLAESVLLAVCAAPLAAAVSYTVPWGFRRAVPTLPAYPFGADAAVWIYLGGTTLLAGVAAGLAPAFESLKRDVTASLHGYDTSMTRGRGWHVRDVLIVAQMAISLVLLIGAGLFVRAEMRFADRNAGYEADRVMLVSPRIRTPPYTITTAATFYDRLAGRARALPGVRGVAFANAPPFGGGDAEQAAPTRFSITSANGDRLPLTIVNTVSPDYFAVLGIPIVRGSVFTGAEVGGRVRPAVVSASAARAIAADRDPVGELVLDDAGRGWQIVGVARDIVAPGSKGPDLTMYVPRPPEMIGDVMAVRFDGDGRALAGGLRKAIADLDPDAMAEPRTVAAIRDDMTERLFRLIRLILLLAVAALVLALIGIYGVVAFAVRVRLREFGIHMALGATRAGIVGLVLRSGARPIAVGAAAGVVVSLAASTALTHIFQEAPFPLDPRDPVVYALVATVLAAAAVLAMLGPAVRAARADPAFVLRQD